MPHTQPALRFGASLLVALVLLGGIGPSLPAVRATDPSEVNAAIGQQRRIEAELAAQRTALAGLEEQQQALTGDVERLTADLKAVGTQLADAEKRLAGITAELDATRAALKRYRARVVQLEKDLVAVAEDITETRRELARREALLEDHLRIAYEKSQVSLLEVLASSDTLGDAATEMSAMVSLSEEDQRLADDIRETRRRLEIRQRTLREGRATLRALVAETAEREALLGNQQRRADEARALLDQQRRHLAAYRAEQERVLAAIASNRQQTEELVAAHERALAGQRQLVRQLTAEARRLGIAYRGRFAWPEKGDFIVTQEFGSTSFDEAHTGMDLAYNSPKCNGPIRAAADGVVLADGRPNRAYGDDGIGVIVGHSQTLQTWYWHLSSEVVSVGQKVKAGDLLGYEGKTGLATGCHLHFQVMADGQPVDPRPYLP
ncbi:MAG TPA: peptidoglycan DD-metalloendopeptidase family protein [Candidatus Limnocylindria bacterium]|nr:peptidoglycan DD-metalloendopeptidase family protein [Candidatus Limnocylindria bacterium]